MEKIFKIYNFIKMTYKQSSWRRAKYISQKHTTFDHLPATKDIPRLKMLQEIHGFSLEMLLTC